MLQTEPRFRKRVPCTLRTAGRSHTGMVLNLSRGGLFVQTSAHVAPGADVSVELNVPPSSRIPLGARVVWRRVVAPQLRTVSQGGFGVRIENASEEYYRFLSGLLGSEAGAASARAPAAAAPPEPEAETGPAFRVRLKHATGPRTRCLTLRAASAEEAGRKALARAGSEWRVLVSEPVA